jgi:hypothetical protein
MDLSGKSCGSLNIVKTHRGICGVWGTKDGVLSMTRAKLNWEQEINIYHSNILKTTEFATIDLQCDKEHKYKALI